MFLKEYDGSIAHDPSIEQVHEGLQALSTDGKLFLILKRDRQHYIQTHINDSGLFDLEFRDGSEMRHYFIEVPCDLRTVIEAFTSYFEGGNGWRTLVEWQRERVSA
jgi:hypothetical protein